MSSVRKLKEFIRKKIYKIIKQPVQPVSYSQAGEDAVLKYLFSDYGLSLDKIKYLDLGTNNPISCNNTYQFYINGSTGVCVDADSTLIDTIKKERPLDKVIHAGVSVTQNGEADFYIFSEPSINTFSKTEAEHRESFGNFKVIRVDKVPLITINDLIKNNFESYPDFISLDIEGMDLEVLRSLDISKYPVPVICVETCQYSESHIRPKDFEIIKFMETMNYEIYADTYINTIFVNKEWFYNK